MKKRFLKIAALALGTALACAPFAACADGGSEGLELIGANTQYTVTEKGTPEPVYSIGFDIMGGKDVMPIGGWWGPYEPQQDVVNGVELPDYVSDYYFGLMQEAGVNFNVVSPETWGANKQSVEEALDLSAKYNMGYFVYDPVVSDSGKLDTMQERLDLYMSHPACIGVHSIDEPKANAFDALGKVYERFGELGYNNQYLFTNLLPNYAADLSGTGSPMVYEEYLREYFEKVDSGFLSFDHYPFTRAGMGTDNMRQYFENLSAVRQVAEENEIPFWTFIQLGGQWNDSGAPRDITYPLFPSEAETYWNINTSLAYGAKAIEYYCIFQPINYIYTLDGFNFEHFAMFGAAGNINSWYYYAKNADMQIQAIDHVLMNASSEGIITLGRTASSNIMGDEKIESGSFRQLTGITGETEDTNAIVGCFDYLGGTALYVVNYSVYDKQQVTLHFDAKYGYDVVQRGRKVSVAGKDLPLTLEAGEGVLVTLR